MTIHRPLRLIRAYDISSSIRQFFVNDITLNKWKIAWKIHIILLTVAMVISHLIVTSDLLK